MTTQEFIDELGRIREQFVWTLEPDRGVHADRRRWPRLHLRGIPVGDPTGARPALDPMGAVCFARTGEVLEPRAWMAAGDALGLIPARAADLHAAADDATWAGEEGRREPVEYLQTLRRRLLEAVGVELPTPHTPLISRK